MELSSSNVRIDYVDRILRDSFPELQLQLRSGAGHVLSILAPEHVWRGLACRARPARMNSRRPTRYNGRRCRTMPG